KSMITAAVMAAGLLISGSAAAAETTIRMLLPPTIGMLPFYVAKEKGYFQKHDLRIEDKFMFNLSTMVPAVVSGQADIVQTDSFYLLSAAEAGLDIVLVGSNGVTGPNTSLNTIVVLKESPIRTAADLVGKRVAVSGVNTHFHIIAAHWLKQNSVDPARVTFVELPFNKVADALKSGRLDAGTAAPPFSYRIATSIGRTLYNFGEMLPPGSLTGTLV